ncbi:RNB domain-containing ribonuclease [Pseudonocardia kujensis]|uniref:RNB domain-containing ribonuclease n=1 Tax=Pseudonocardia kujensis TaxID=1128675 RepID=UPI001E557666|nr:RNB domain-containing ribonuclease [Pseudonocardia kujensis]MCE0767548.1 RNB domain-containing ribonuclease [Pseudonocardia kujensis]
MSAVPDFAAVRAEFGLPADGTAFPPAVLAEAERAAAAGPDGPRGGPRTDATDVPLVTIDPPGSKDLDQAVGLTRTPRGFTVHYAIADLGAVVEPGGPLDAEVRRRGQTLYLPDGAVPLHPPVLSEDAASLLPDGPRAAVLWRIDLDREGAVVRADVRRALVRSLARLDYAGVQAAIDAGRPHPAIAALAELGPLRRARAVARGAIELELPEQEVVPDGAGWTVRVRRRTPVEDWNAEISLLTGQVAAQMMLDAGVGVLRTLPAPEPEAVAALRATALELGLDWPEGESPARVLAALPRPTDGGDGGDPRVLAVRRAATTLLRGAAYESFGVAGTPPPGDPGHGGVGAPYAHVTAPLRRLVDRFAGEVCLTLAAGREVPGWLAEALPALPGVMSASDTLAARVDRACTDRTEAAVLADRVGEEFEVVVLRREPAEVFLADPPVLAKCDGRPRPGTLARARLVEADPTSGRVRFALPD